MIYSLFAMMLLTGSVAAYGLKLRLYAGKTGPVNVEFFRSNHNTDLPSNMRQALRNYTHLLEMPVFFTAQER